MKRRVLFVDDEPRVLEGLRRMLRSVRQEWDMSFAAGGQEALDKLSNEEFQVLVTDMRMPEMDGLTLLKHVRDHYPALMRIVLSGHTENDAILRSTALAHQFLAKPSEPDIVIGAVRRAINLHTQIANPRLLEIINGMQNIPSLPSVYMELMEEMQSEDCSMETIGEIIARDIGMTAKILQLVNSAFFGLPREISDPAAAAAYLGIDTVAALVLSVKVFAKYEGAALKGLSLDQVWDHSLSCSRTAKRLVAREDGSRQEQTDAMLAGMLHDCGKLILMVNLPEEYQQVVDRAAGDPHKMLEAERDVLNATHAECGAHLLAKWGLPESVVEAVAHHHSPRDCGEMGFGITAAVHVANALCLAGADVNRAGDFLDLEYIRNMGLDRRLPTWLAECGSTETSE